MTELEGKKRDQDEIEQQKEIKQKEIKQHKEHIDSIKAELKKLENQKKALEDTYEESKVPAVDEK